MIQLFGFLGVGFNTAVISNVFMLVTDGGKICQKGGGYHYWEDGITRQEGARQCQTTEESYWSIWLNKVTRNEQGFIMAFCIYITFL